MLSFNQSLLRETPRATSLTCAARVFALFADCWRDAVVARIAWQKPPSVTHAFRSLALAVTESRACSRTLTTCIRSCEGRVREWPVGSLREGAPVGNGFVCRVALAFVAAMVGCVSCGSADPSGTGDPKSDENTGLQHQFVVWTPGTALVNEHTTWHLGQCDTPGARRCNLMGEEFFSFHRNYISRLRDAFEASGTVADISPWTQLPPEMKNPSNGWSPWLQSVETAVFTQIDPATGQRFASLDLYGLFVEQNYHNYLHGIAQAAYGESAIGPVSMSPTSTYFFKIHGLVEWLYQRYQRGDLNRDGMNDLLVRNTTTGVNRVWFLSGPSTVLSKQTIDSKPVDVCGWYMGASADFDYDGVNDIVWHGPGCSSTEIWRMGGATGLTHVSTVSLPSVDNAWVLIGSGDFNGDSRPDLVWKSTSTQTISFWRMKGTTFLDSTALTVPTGYTAVATIDMNSNLNSSLLLQGGTSTAKTFHVLNTTGAFLPSGAVSTPLGKGTAATGVFNSTTTLVGTGHYHNGQDSSKGKRQDLVFRDSSTSFSVYSWVGSSREPYEWANPIAITSAEQLQGPR